MKLLLDTHSFLWWIFDDPKLSSKARSAIANRKMKSSLAVLRLGKSPPSIG